MSNSFAGNARLTFTGELDSTVNLGSVSHLLSYVQNPAFANGTGANQANMVFADTRTLAASTSESLDLSGVLTNAFGASILFTKIKGIIIAAAAANTNNVLVGGAASNAFINWVGDATDIITVRPGGLFCLMAPDATAYAVTAGTGDLLKINNSSSGTGVTYDVILIGTV